MKTNDDRAESLRSSLPALALEEKVKGESTVLAFMMSANWKVTSSCGEGGHGQFHQGEFLSMVGAGLQQLGKG